MDQSKKAKGPKKPSWMVDPEQFKKWPYPEDFADIELRKPKIAPAVDVAKAMAHFIQHDQERMMELTRQGRL
ncbi:hypothetical protein [Massilia sp. NP310]|uniref:hypothetical protein n=1 Tax=Massilia sp. NP310 TaxID=2861282 RepID=UPI001C62A52C|nr:hypothetical protein [Massilia sp. NP310]QYG04044.1 hypothetical protein KY496_12000 [Massilia sp. NP310]